MRWSWWIVVFSAACGSSSSPSSMLISQTGGTWTGPVTLTSAIGVPDQFTLVITQTGTSLSATGSTQTAGQTCSYFGTAGDAKLALDSNICTPGGVRLTCGGNLRDALLARRSITASVNGSVMTGTISESWSVFVAGTNFGVLGLIDLSSAFTLNRTASLPDR
jgi:hypothetical protein